MNNNELKSLLAKMLPETLGWNGLFLYWHDKGKALDTELDRLCWLVQDGLTEEEQYQYALKLLAQVAVNQPFHYGKQCGRDYFGTAHATWQQRTEALAGVKGVAL